MGVVHEDLPRKRLAELRIEHRDLDDVIARLESELIPDLDA